MTTQPEWWETFFTGRSLELQKAVGDDEWNRAEADFLERVLQVTPGGRVLDVACGNGRHSLELASRGYLVTGVDVSLPMLGEARRRAATGDLAVTWIRRDMRDLPWVEEFGGAFCFGGSFGFFDDENNSAFAEAVYRTLKPGARFLIDAHTPETLFPVFRGRDWTLNAETLVLHKRTWDHEAGRVNDERTMIYQGQVTHRLSSTRLYTYRELCELLADVGFVEPQGFGSLSLEPFRLGSRRLYLVATKPGPDQNPAPKSPPMPGQQHCGSALNQAASSWPGLQRQ